MRHKRTIPDYPETHSEIRVLYRYRDRAEYPEDYADF
jgi:hypothetical protein